MRRWLVLSLLLSLVPSFVVAAQATPHPPYKAQSSLIYGSDFNVLSFDQNLDKYSLVVVFGIPSAPAFDWPFAVYNGTGKAIKNLRLKVYEWVDGKRTTFDDNAWVYPLVIAPGEFGFGGATLELNGNHFVAGPENGLDAELTARPLEPADKVGDLFDLMIESATVSESGHVEGELRNETDDGATKIEIHELCVEDSGIPINYFSQILDRRLLKAGAVADFEVNMDSCDGESFLTAFGEKA